MTTKEKLSEVTTEIERVANAGLTIAREMEKRR